MTRKRPATRHVRATAPARAAKHRAAKRRKKTGKSNALNPRPGLVDVQEIESLRGEIERVARGSGPPRWNANPDDVRRSVVKLVLTLVEFIRQLLERQAMRRVDAGTLTAEETEAVGLALMRLEETVRDLAAQFDLAQEDLNVDLGPIGKLV